MYMRLYPVIHISQNGIKWDEFKTLSIFGYILF